MNRHATTRTLFALLCLPAITACDSDAAEPELTVRSSELTAAGCPSDRQIARLTEPAQECPSVTGWIAAPLFADVEGEGELAEFCQYRWGLAGSPDLDAFASRPAIVGLASDCEVVTEQSGDALWSEIGDDLEQLYHDGIGWVSPADVDFVGVANDRWPVIVAVIDSVPEPAPNNPRSEHGLQMADLVDEIACPDPLADCAVEVRRYLGLPRYGTGQLDPVRGGNFGSQGDLARAIYAAVRDWETTNWTGQTPKLILNMSVAWEGELFGDTVDQSPAVDAVFAALEYAHCHGALIIAAAGNEGYACTTGPLLPGGWEQFPGPDAARCAELGAPTPPGGTGYRPLLYSVGGIDHDHEPMPGTRQDGLPRLVATAAHVPPGDDSTSLTGTSVSSAGTAGAAALVWSFTPHLNPTGVMNSIYLGGDSSSWTADYAAPNASLTSIHGVDVCKALEYACDRPGSSCPFTTPLTCSSAPASASLADIAASLAALSPVPTVAPTFGPEVACPSDCSGDEVVGYASTAIVGSSDPCPVQIDPALAFTLPQPTQIGCPNCTLDPISAIVHASLDPEYDNAGPVDVLVSVSDGLRETAFRFGVQPLDSTTITRLELDPALMPAAVRSATISLSFATLPRPVTNELLIAAP